jgi:hypothetical protein
MESVRTPFADWSLSFCEERRDGHIPGPSPDLCAEIGVPLSLEKKAQIVLAVAQFRDRGPGGEWPVIPPAVRDVFIESLDDERQGRTEPEGRTRLGAQSTRADDLNRPAVGSPGTRLTRRTARRLRGDHMHRRAQSERRAARRLARHRQTAPLQTLHRNA